MDFPVLFNKETLKTDHTVGLPVLQTAAGDVDKQIHVYYVNVSLSINNRCSCQKQMNIPFVNTYNELAVRSHYISLYLDATSNVKPLKREIPSPVFVM